jgi:hypothetical protein
MSLAIEPTETRIKCSGCSGYSEEHQLHLLVEGPKTRTSLCFNCIVQSIQLLRGIAVSGHYNQERQRIVAALGPPLGES